jgi:hypothetical protein
MTCLKASPYKATENSVNEKRDKAKPASCLVRVKFTKKGNKFVMDITMASLQDAGGPTFLSDHYKMPEEDAKRFSTTAPLFLNTKNLREGLLDPFIEKEGAQFKDRRAASEAGSTRITPGKVVFWILWLVAMVLLGISLTWVFQKARNAVTGSAELGKLEGFLILLALVILGGLMAWLGFMGIFLIGIGPGIFLTLLKIIFVGGERRRAPVAAEGPPAEEDEEEDE